jgi:putative membrane protein
LTYRRIQDIHVTRNLLERWMGLAKISVQTASGSGKAELVIEGIKQPEALRDFLYRRMRGARNESSAADGPSGEPGASDDRAAVEESRRTGDQALSALIDIRDALRELVRQRGRTG